MTLVRNQTDYDTISLKNSQNWELNTVSLPIGRVSPVPFHSLNMATTVGDSR